MKRGVCVRVKCLFVTAIFFLSFVGCMVHPVQAHASSKIDAAPSTVTLNEGDSTTITVTLDQPIVGSSPPGYLDIPFVASDSARVSFSPSGTVHYDESEWTMQKTFTITAVDDATHNDSNTVSVTATAASNSEYYSGYQTGFTVTIVDNDPAPDPPPPPSPTPPDTPPTAPAPPATPAPSTTKPPTSAAPVAQPAPAAVDQKITLDDLQGFTSGDYQQLSVKQGEIIHFMLNGVQHTITVKEITANYVIVTVASTPKDVQIPIGQSVDYDVDGNASKDIRLTAVSGNSDGATVGFQYLLTSAVAKNPAVVVRTTSSRGDTLALVILGSAALILLGTGTIFTAQRRRKKMTKKRVPAASERVTLTPAIRPRPTQPAIVKKSKTSRYQG